MADVQISLESDVIRVHYRGRADFGATTQLLRDVGKMGQETQSKRVLFDMRDADYRGYYVQTLQHAQQGPSLGIDRGFRIALLGTENPMLGYFEDVAVNRGYRAKAFTDEAAALAWLRTDGSARRF